MAEKTGSEIIVDHLIKEDIPYIIGIPGHGCLAFVDALYNRREKIKQIQVRHEQSAVHMADGYYRVAKKPLAVYSSIGPGALNLVMGMANAYVDSVPVLGIIGETHTYMFGRGVLQEIERDHWANSYRVFEPVTKKTWQVTRVDQLPRVMNSAFNSMLTGRRGPVVINLPMDVQADSIEVPDYQPQNHRATSFIEPDYTPTIRPAMEMLTNAKRPVVLIGGGLHHAEAYAELKQFVERIGAAVICTFGGKGSIEEDHPLYVWHAGSKGTDCGNHFARTADVVLAIGCRFADQSTSSYKFGETYRFPETKLIHVDIDPYEIGKNYPVDVGIVGDLKFVLKSMNQYCETNGINRDWENGEYFKEIQEIKRKWFEKLADSQGAELSPITISNFFKVFRGIIDRDAIVVTSSGNSQAQLLQEFPILSPGANITTHGFSAMGFAVPAAMGAKLAAPEKQVFAVVGDGDFMMTMQEMATAVQYNIPIVIIVLNNSAWQAITDLQISAFGEERVIATKFEKHDINELYSPDFSEVAKNFGLYSEKVENPNDVGNAVRRAIEVNKPALIEIIVNQNYPYSGGSPTGWWDVPIPTYLEEKRKAYEQERSKIRYQ